MDAEQLIKKYIAGTCTDAEKALVETFYAQQLQNGSFPESDVNPNIKDKIWANIQAGRKNEKGHKSIRVWISYAAAILIFAIGIGYIVQNSVKQPADHPIAKQVDSGPIHPGSHRATLTLENGQSLELSENQTGIVVGDQIAYSDGTELLDAFNENQWARLKTPRGGTYQVRLPDGTVVRLNAASSLRYPVHFNGNQRVVELEGEAYFTVTKNPDKPFIVKSNGQQIQVLGTIFNISAYAEEGYTQTSLVEGSVKVTNDAGKHLILKPNESATLDASGKLYKQNVDVNSKIAWMHGYFSFDDESIHSILRKISRWYNVDIVYQDTIRDMSLLGVIPRSGDIKQVLKSLEHLGGIKFKIENRTIVVMK